MLVSPGSTPLPCPLPSGLAWGEVPCSCWRSCWCCQVRNLGPLDTSLSFMLTLRSVSVLPPKQLLSRPPPPIVGLLPCKGCHHLWPGHCPSLFTLPPTHPPYSGLIENTNLTMSLPFLKPAVAPCALGIKSRFTHTNPGPPFHLAVSFPASLHSRCTWPLASHLQGPIPLSSLPNGFSSAQQTLHV